AFAPSVSAASFNRTSIRRDSLQNSFPRAVSRSYQSGRSLSRNQPPRFLSPRTRTNLPVGSTSPVTMPVDLSGGRLLEIFQSGDHSGLIHLGELVIERQPQQTIAYILGHRAIPFFATELPAHAREMER